MNAIVPLSLMRPGEAWFGWTDEAVETLRRLCDEGYSAAQIALQMGLASRGAVIGKATRLGLELHGKNTGGPQRIGRLSPQIPRAKEYPEGASGTARKASSPVNPDQDLRSRSAITFRSPGARVGQGVRVRSEKRARLIERATPAPESKWISIVELEPTSCRWPRGDPGCDDFSYCGAQIEPDHSYCPHHCGLAYAGTAASYAKSTERNQWLMKA